MLVTFMIVLGHQLIIHGGRSESGRYPNMRGHRNFRQGGGPGQPYKKSSDNVFCVCVCVFLSPQLIFRSQTVNFKEIYDFSRFQRGSNIFQGGVLLFPGGSICLFSIETNITCDFPGGGVRTPCPPPPLDPHLPIGLMATSRCLLVPINVHTALHASFK